VKLLTKVYIKGFKGLGKTTFSPKSSWIGSQGNSLGANLKNLRPNLALEWATLWLISPNYIPWGQMSP